MGTQSYRSTDIESRTAEPPITGDWSPGDSHGNSAISAPIFISRIGILKQAAWEAFAWAKRGKTSRPPIGEFAGDRFFTMASSTRQFGTIGLLAVSLALTGCLAKESTFTGSGAPDPGDPPSTNSPPSISGNPDNAVTSGNSYSFTPTAADPDGDALTFNSQNLPGWASFDTGTGRITGQPLLGDVGTYQSILVSVSDGTHTTSLPSFSISVMTSNDVPVISGTPSGSVTVGQAYNFTPTASDPNGDTLSFSISGQPQWLNFDTTTGRLNGTPVAADVGTHGAITIIVSDGSSSSSLSPFSINVVEDTGPPTGDEIARGVPNPSTALGFDPFTFDPAVTSTRGDLPSVVNGGEVIVVTGGNGGGQVTFNCSAAEPCVLKSDGTPRTQGIGVSGSYFVVDGFVFQGDNTESVHALSGANHFVVRNVTHSGSNSRTGNGTSMYHSGGNVAVYYNNTIRNIAVADGSDEVDYMAFSVASGSNVWVVGNTSYQVGGDSLKLGQNVARAGGVFPRNIYVSGNDFGNNGENPIDIKWAVDIVISDNDLHDSRQSVSSSGECTVIHESGDNVRFLDNRFTNCTTGVETATSGGGANYIEIDGNTLTNVQLGVHNRGGGHADITNNICINVSQMYENETNNGSTVSASGNCTQ